MPEYISSLRNNCNEQMTITNRFFILAISYTRFCLSFKQNVRRDILGKHAKHPIAIQTIDICMRWNALVKNNIGATLNAIRYGRYRVTMPFIVNVWLLNKSHCFDWFWKHVIEISSILSLLNEATTIKNIFQNPLVRIITLLV